MIPKIRKMDDSGDSPIPCNSVLEAAEVINDHVDSGGWAFADGQMFSGGKVSQADLAGVEQILLSNPIVGG